MVEKEQQLLVGGEGLTVEFKQSKSKLNKDVFETVCAFLNRSGGYLLLGVDNNGQIVGIDPQAKEKIKKDFVTSMNNPLKISPTFYLTVLESAIEGKDILYIHIPDKFYLEKDQRVSLRDKIFREVVSNILIHREFLNPFPAKLIIEKDRVYAENSNKPHGNGIIDPHNFSPFPKNPNIAKLFKEIGWVDELGSGVRNIYKYNKIYSGAEPSFIEGDVFKTIIPLTTEASTQVGAQAGAQASAQAGAQVDYTDLDDDNRINEILDYCKKPRTRIEIQEMLGMQSRSYFRKTILKPLVNGGLLKLTLPTKPTSPNQRYYSDNI